MALTANTPRDYRADPQHYTDYPVAADTRIWEGSAVSVNAGVAGPQNAAHPFAGFAAREADNRINGGWGDGGSGGAGDKSVSVLRKGVVHGLAVTGATSTTAIGTAVYATDSGTFTLTASGGRQIGKVEKPVGTDTADVDFEGEGYRSP